MSWSYHKDKNLLFIHIPKCAGSSLNSILGKQLHFNSTSLFIKLGTKAPHKDWVNGFYKFMKNNEDKIEFLKKNPQIFTFVRNPYEKLFSAYQFLHTSSPFLHKKIYNCFEDFVDDKDLLSDYCYLHAFTTQTQHVSDENNELVINHYGKVESLMEDLNKIIENYNFKDTNLNEIHANSSKEVKIYEHYNNKLIEFVNQHFHDDFENFNYKKFQNLNEMEEYYKLINRETRENKKVSYTEKNVKNRSKDLLSKNKIKNSLLNFLNEKL